MSSIQGPDSSNFNQQLGQAVQESNKRVVVNGTSYQLVDKGEAKKQNTLSIKKIADLASKEFNNVAGSYSQSPDTGKIGEMESRVKNFQDFTKKYEDKVNNTSKFNVIGRIIRNRNLATLKKSENAIVNNSDYKKFIENKNKEKFSNDIDMLQSKKEVLHPRDYEAAKQKLVNQYGKEAVDQALKMPDEKVIPPKSIKELHIADLKNSPLFQSRVKKHEGGSGAA